MKIMFFITLVTLFSTSYSVLAEPLQIDIKGELSSDELARINAREFVVKKEEIKDSVWPEITYYALIEVSPLEAIALFAGYDIQKDYVPNVIKSHPVKHVSATDVHTEYELRIPFPLSNAHYTHGARVYRHGEDYQTVWYMVKSSSAEEVKGSAYFASYNGKTLFRYRSYVKPKSIFGSFVKKMMFKDVEKTMTAIRAFIEKSKAENPALISKYSEFITRALRGEFVYQTIIEKK